jgi:hypothetical protein
MLLGAKGLPFARRAVRSSRTMSEYDREIEKLAERVRAVPVSDAQREAHRRSFAYGNGVIENPRITREIVDRVADKMPRTAK